MQSWQLKAKRKLDILKQCEIFRGLDSASLRALAEISIPRQQAPGETLFYQDAEASLLYQGITCLTTGNDS